MSKKPSGRFQGFIRSEAAKSGLSAERPRCFPVPKGQPRIARRFNAGSAGAGISPAGTADSVPEISLIKFDSVFLKELQEFLLKTFRAMMLWLICDVCHDGIKLRNAHTERAVFLLPAKLPLVRKSLVNPL